MKIVGNSGKRKSFPQMDTNRLEKVIFQHRKWRKIWKKNIHTIYLVYLGHMVNATMKTFHWNAWVKSKLMNSALWFLPWKIFKWNCCSLTETCKYLKSSIWPCHGIHVTWVCQYAIPFHVNPFHTMQWKNQRKTLFVPTSGIAFLFKCAI